MSRSAVLFGVLALAACRTEPAALAPTLASTARSVATPSASMLCGTSTLERTACMIELMLADIRATYDWPDGGGISQIVGESSTSYTVSLPQEERADLITYDFEVSGDTVSMVGRKEGTESY